MKTRILAALFALAAVYLAVWPHEIGHATAAWLYGCKADPWRTGTHWYLAGSHGGALDEACLARRPHALGATAAAGIAVNLALALLASCLAASSRRPFHLFLFIALANAAEALSYLIVGSLWPAADMAVLVREAGAGRGPWAAAGLALLALAVPALRRPVRRAAAALAVPAWLFPAYALAVAAAAVASRAFLSAGYN